MRTAVAIVCCAVVSLAAAERVSVSSSGAQGDSYSWLADLSDNGRYALFVSSASTLIDEAPSRGVYLRDRWLRRTDLVLVLPGRYVGLVEGLQSRISGDGHWFVIPGIDGGLTSSDGLVHVIRKDLPGIVASAVDRSSTGTLANASSGNPAISDDGRYVAWDSRASNLVDAAFATGSTSAVYWRDVVTGDTRVVSLGTSGRADAGWAWCGGISDDGALVVFAAQGTGFTSGTTTTGAYVGNPSTEGVERIDRGIGGAAPDGAVVGLPRIAGGGRWVAFASSATNLVAGDRAGHVDVFVADRLHGRLASGIERVSVGLGGAEPDADCLDPAISDDGRWVVFHSTATNLVAGAGGVDHDDVFVRDRLLGTTRRVNTRWSGGEAREGQRFYPAVSGAGALAGWTSGSDDHVLGDTNGWDDAFVAATAPPRRFVLPPWLVRLLERFRPPVGQG